MKACISSCGRRAIPKLPAPNCVTPAERAFADATLVRVELVTGLQNQIRAQFSAIGHPLIGDRKYRPKEAEEQLIDRVALHAAYLEFVHPRTGERIVIECAPPAGFPESHPTSLARPNVPAGKLSCIFGGFCYCQN